MTIPDHESLMPRVLELGQAEQSVVGAVAAVSNQLGLSDEEREQLIPSGGKPLIKSRVEWAITYLVNAVLLERPRRAHFVITDRGREVLASHPPKIDSAFLRQFPEFVDFLERKRNSPTSNAPTASVPSVETGKTPEELMGEAYETLEGELGSSLRNRILQMSPTFFEQLVIKLLSAMGYGSAGGLAEAIGKSGDGGLDGVIHQDHLGLDVVYVQAKRYAVDRPVGRPDLQAFVGALSGVSAHKGLFVTTSSFSSPAVEYLQTIPQRVVTIDGARLVELMISLGVGVRVRRRYELHRIDEDFFLEE